LLSKGNKIQWNGEEETGNGVAIIASKCLDNKILGRI
jgi:hypothetical protein